MFTSDDLLSAVRAHDAARVLSVLSSHLELAAPPETGPSALLLAAYTGQAELAGQMVALGVTPTLWEASALGWAEHLHLSAQPSLLDQYSGDGFTALGLASYFGRTEVVKQLLAYGADVECASRNAQQVRPIHSAVSGRHLDVLWLLIRHGADVNARQERGYTPLHQAVHGGLIEAARLLLAAGADPTVQDDEGVSPVEMARREGQAAAEQLVAWAAWTPEDTADIQHP